MPIIDLQRRARELGRIRIGQVQPTSNGRTRPAKLDRFRITSASRPLLDRIAELYGGQVREWTPQGSNVQAWEVITDSTRLPVLVPPQPVTQWYELWSGGGCQRRCDGVREVLKDQACPCGPDPAERTCKPTTRLNVVLREVEGIGVFRLETHGYYAAVELPMAAELLAAAGGYISGFLTLEERQVVRDGKTNRFMVPALDIEMTPAQLLASGGMTAVAAPDRTAAVAGPAARAALPAGPAGPEGAPATSSGKPLLTAEEEQLVLQQIADAATVEAVRAMWRDLASAYHLDTDGPIVSALRGRASALQPAAAPADDDGDPDTLWVQIVNAIPQDWTSDQLERDFAAFAETPAEQASAADMRRYLAVLPERTGQDTRAAS